MEVLLHSSFTHKNQLGALQLSDHHTWLPCQACNLHNILMQLNLTPHHMSKCGGCSSSHLSSVLDVGLQAKETWGSGYKTILNSSTGIHTFTVVKLWSHFHMVSKYCSSSIICRIIFMKNRPLICLAKLLLDQHDSLRCPWPVSVQQKRISKPREKKQQDSLSNLKSIITT